jgi:hypothetical protein
MTFAGEHGSVGGLNCDLCDWAAGEGDAVGAEDGTMWRVPGSSWAIL